MIARCPECGTSWQHRPGDVTCRILGLRAALDHAGFVAAEQLPSRAFIELCENLKMTRRELTQRDVHGQLFGEIWVPWWAYRIWRLLPGSALIGASEDQRTTIAFARRLFEYAKGRPRTQAAILAALYAGADRDFLEHLIGGNHG